MQDQKKTTKIRLHNPKSVAPAVYIPNWMSQIPTSQLSSNCKLVYGRLAQWCTSKGKAHRSAADLSVETGIPLRSVEHAIKQLKDSGLLGTFIPRKGGHNHYEFYDHEWMHAELDERLCYAEPDLPSSLPFDPPQPLRRGTATIAEGYATIAEHKIKLNKINKNTTTKAMNKTKKKETLPKEKKSSSSFSLEEIIEEAVDKQTELHGQPDNLKLLRIALKKHITDNLQKGDVLPGIRVGLLRMIAKTGFHISSKLGTAKTAREIDAEEKEKRAKEKAAYKPNITKAAEQLKAIRQIAKGGSHEISIFQGQQGDKNTTGYQRTAGRFGRLTAKN